MPLRVALDSTLRLPSIPTTKLNSLPKRLTTRVISSRTCLPAMNASCSTAPLCPVISRISSPVSAFHSTIVPLSSFGSAQAISPRDSATTGKALWRSRGWRTSPSSRLIAPALLWLSPCRSRHWTIRRPSRHRESSPPDQARLRGHSAEDLSREHQGILYTLSCEPSFFSTASVLGRCKRFLAPRLLCLERFSARALISNLMPCESTPINLYINRFPLIEIKLEPQQTRRIARRSRTMDRATMIP